MTAESYNERNRKIGLPQLWATSLVWDGCSQEEWRNAEALPPEFRRDVVEVARWAKQAKVDDGLAESAKSREQTELVALRRRAWVLEKGVENLRRATVSLAKDAAPQ